MSSSAKEEQINYLQKIKSLFSSSLYPDLKNNKQETIDTTREINVIELNKLIQRIENLEKMLKMLNNNQKEGVRKNKVKEQIISLLQQNKKLTSSQLSKLIGLSRTRCSEYFRELTREGKTEGIIIGRQKYYRLVKK